MSTSNDTSQDRKSVMRQVVEAFADAIIERVPGLFKIAQWLPVGFFLGVPQTGRAGMANAYARIMLEWERLKGITTLTLMATALFSIVGVSLYVISYIVHWPMLAVTGGILISIALVIFFLYLYLIQAVVRLIKKEEDVGSFDPTTEAGKKRLEKLQDEKKKLAGMFAKGIMWVCIYLFFAIRLEPWTDLTLFFTFNLSLFILLLLKKASHMGRMGYKTMGDYAEWALIASFTVYFLGSLSFYWISGFEKAGINGPRDFVKVSSDALGETAMLVPNAMNDFFEDWNLDREHQELMKAASDLNNDGFTDRLDSALMIGDINGDRKIDSVDLKTFSTYYRILVADTEVADNNTRTWVLNENIGPHSQPVGDVNGDFIVDDVDSIYLHEYIYGNGRPPIYVTDWGLLPAVTSVNSDDSDESMEYGQAEALDSGHTYNSVRTVRVGTPLSGTESYFTLIVDEVEYTPELTIVTLTWSNPRGNKDRATVDKLTQIRFAQGKYYV
ncbi:hypothetical protein IID19_02010, partial [Patescibacteria group bacterium]|nr:hypothetical protein [Patescibacteria group bacterium]